MTDSTLDHDLALRGCEALLRFHGLVAKGWKVIIRPLRADKEALGITTDPHSNAFCAYDSKLIVLDVSLSKPFELGDVMLHEIAHALLPADEDHSHKWAAKALEIGVSETNVKAHCPTYFEECEL